MNNDDGAWYLDGQAYYGGCIAPGDTLEPYQYSVSCPKCGKEASREDYQRVEGGCLNSYLRTQCSHCGYAADTGDYDD
ncbi:hypothetical protein BBD72_23760 [Salmonella enterica]|nr:hypothetical protein [Salmonella enterica]